MTFSQKFLFLFLLFFYTSAHAINLESINSVFTPEEIEYLNKKKHVTMCVDPNWMPFEKIEDGRHIGMTSEYFKLIENEIGIVVQVVPTKTWSESIEFAKKRKCDIFSLAMENKERKEYMNFTEPYLEAPLVISTRMNTVFIADPKEVITKPLGITKGYAYIEILKEKYPEINLVEFETLDDGLEAVRKNEVFGYIDNLLTSGYKIQQKYFGEIKIAGKFDDKWKLGIGVRNDDPMLLEIMEKAIKLVKYEEYNAIINKWVSIKYESGFDYSLFWKIVAVLLIFILFGLYRHYELNELIVELQEKDKQLKKLSITDALSELYNRRYFDEVFGTEFNRSKRNGDSLIFGMLDIDFFKKYNDRYGHQKGDEVIKSIGSILNSYTKRGGDYSFRLGGEEFGILLHLDHSESVVDYFEHIRESVENLNIEHQDNPLDNKITISIGVVEIMNFNHEITTDLVYKMADEQLYCSKDEGRNRVSFKRF